MKHIRNQLNVVVIWLRRNIYDSIIVCFVII